MKSLIEKFVGKIVDQGLAHEGDITLLGLDAELFSNRPPDAVVGELQKVFSLMNIGSLLYTVPAEPYRTIIRHLTEDGPRCLTPMDCETRTFLHDIPVMTGFSAEAVASALSLRKAAIIDGKAIVAHGSVSPEQAFVSFSSVCFAAFVSYFLDVLCHARSCREGGRPWEEKMRRQFSEVVGRLAPDIDPASDIPAVPPRSEDEVIRGITAAGRELVSNRLVDSYFGNISYVFGDRIFITETGSSMDDLSGAIDAVPLDGSSSAGITASSELSAHLGIYRRTGRRAILHGHPRFTVIMSMSCRKEGCDLSSCYRSCSIPRSLADLPVVSGEIGTGPAGLFRTVPEAMKGGPAVVVFGHGIFATGRDSLREPFLKIREVERRCRELYFSAVLEDR